MRNLKFEDHLEQEAAEAQTVVISRNQAKLLAEIVADARQTVEAQTWVKQLDVTL